jgi:hypothetical protein
MFILLEVRRRTTIYRAVAGRRLAAIAAISGMIALLAVIFRQ